MKSEKTAARKRKPTAPNAEPTKSEYVAYIVSGDGSDEDIRGRCMAAIPDWATLNDKVQAETIRLMRVYWGMSPAPRMDVVGEGDDVTITPPSGGNTTLNALRLVEGMGSNSSNYADARVDDLARYHRSRHVLSSVSLSASLAFVQGAKAADPVQSSLAVQMAATHDAAIRALSRVGSAQFTEQMQVFGNLATKLLNTYTRQAETLAKLQRGGEQVIRHVHIDNRGGQAVVTDTVVTRRGNEESREQAHGQSAFGPALLSSDPQGHGVSVPGDQRKEAVPDSRRGSGIGST